MASSDQEEADARIVLHVHDSLERGSRKLMMHTVGTDIIVILYGHRYSIIDRYPDAEFWVWLLEQVNISTLPPKHHMWSLRERKIKVSSSIL